MSRSVSDVAFGRGSAAVTRAPERVGETATLGRSSLAVLAAASISGGVIHLTLGPDHVGELGALGLGFFVAAGLQISWAGAAALLIHRRGDEGARALAVAGIAINSAVLAAWAAARIVGLPAGAEPWTPEAIGRLDAFVGVLEAAIVITLALALRGGRISRPGRAGASVAAVAMLLIAIGTVVALDVHEAGHGHAPGDEHGAISGESSAR